MNNYRKPVNSLSDPEIKIKYAAVIQMEVNKLSNAPNCPGKTQMLRYLNGERLTRRETGLAKCYQCQAYNADGKRECGNVLCPQNTYMPYLKRNVDLRRNGKLAKINK